MRSEDLSAGSTLLSDAIFYASYDLDPGRGTSRVLFGWGDTDNPPRPSAAEVATLLNSAPVAEPDEDALMHSLDVAVAHARYWQEPDGEDVLAAAPELSVPLNRIGSTIDASPLAEWWSSPLEATDQWMVDLSEQNGELPAVLEVPASATEILHTWSGAIRAEEAMALREWPADPQAAFSGPWWSKPPTRLTKTTRSLGARGPAGLRYVEDAFNWDTATAHRVEVPRAARVYEIDGPASWIELCRRYPVAVTASRRQDWYRTTGRTGRWVLPDWARVAEDFDAVHLTVAGYLATAGRALPVADDLTTVLAGWDPDQTYWLCDVTPDEPTRQDWHRDADGRWMRRAGHRGKPRPPGELR